jgi:adenylate cyclase class 2
MAANQEIEIKFRIANEREVNRRLRCAKFKLTTKSTHEFNTLFDLPGQKLRKRGELLRLRQYGKEWTLTHKAKGKDGRHKSRTELETEVADGRQMDLILRGLGYQPSFRYEKFRAEWSDGKGHVVVDHTPIGDFGEIEGPARWIDRTAKVLGIESRLYVTSTYAELFFQWKQKTKSPAEEMTFRAIARSRRSWSGT